MLVTLCFSRDAFLWISLRQYLAAVLDGLEAAWAFFGGAVKRLGEDNLKPVVTRADRYAPGIDRVFREHAKFRCVLVDPAIVRHATGKTRIEAGVLVAEQWILARLRDETFFSLAALNARIADLLTTLTTRPMRGSTSTRGSSTRGRRRLRGRGPLGRRRRDSRLRQRPPPRSG